MIGGIFCLLEVNSIIRTLLIEKERRDDWRREKRKVKKKKVKLCQENLILRSVFLN